jgi:hypothetical protein
MSERQPVIHDGQGDAMPCECPACRSPFTIHRITPLQRRPIGIVPTATIREPDYLREARAC